MIVALYILSHPLLAMAIGFLIGFFVIGPIITRYRK